MTERERWIVYPLLLLSLGISLRSKITQSLDLHEIRCNYLRCDHIVGRELDTPCRSLVCDNVVATRNVEVVGGDGKARLVLYAEGQKGAGGGALRILSPKGETEVLLYALTAGGLIEVVAPVDQQRKLVRTIGVAGDRVQEFRPAEAGKDDKTKKPASGDKPTDGKTDTPEKPGQPAAEPTTGKPAADKPQADKPGAERPAAQTPADEKPQPEKPSTEGDEQPSEKKPAETPSDQ